MSCFSNHPYPEIILILKFSGFKVSKLYDENMEITTKGITTAKDHLINLMTSIYFTNHEKRQLVDFLKKYSCIIYVKSYLKREFKKFAVE